MAPKASFLGAFVGWGVRGRLIPLQGPVGFGCRVEGRGVRVWGLPIFRPTVTRPEARRSSGFRAVSREELPLNVLLTLL